MGGWNQNDCGRLAGRVWSEFTWLRIGTSGGFLCL
jgi:hypothetical protein